MRWRFLLLVFGLSLILFGGVQEIVLWCVASRTPQELNCDVLGRDGPGRNAHILLRDYFLCTNAFVYEERGGRWTVAWVPAVARGVVGMDGTLPPDAVRVLVKMPHARGMSDIVHAEHVDAIEGIVTNAIEDLGEVERARLEALYPGVDFERCQIFEVGRELTGVVRVLGSIVGGMFLIVYVLWSILGGQPVAHGPLPPELERRGARAGRDVTTTAVGAGAIGAAAREESGHGDEPDPPGDHVAHTDHGDHVDHEDPAVPLAAGSARSPLPPR